MTRLSLILRVPSRATRARDQEHEDALSWGSHCLYACGFRIYFTPLPGFFSPFPHGTGSLSVDYEYLALEDGPPIFRQDFTCPALLVATLVPRSRFRIRGYHPLWPAFPDRFASSNAKSCKALPISLATTFGISVDFCSSGY
jgi:hypothetical protein